MEFITFDQKEHSSMDQTPCASSENAIVIEAPVISTQVKVPILVKKNEGLRLRNTRFARPGSLMRHITNFSINGYTGTLFGDTSVKPIDAFVSACEIQLDTSFAGNLEKEIVFNVGSTDNIILLHNFQGTKKDVTIELLFEENKLVLFGTGLFFATQTLNLAMEAFTKVIETTFNVTEQILLCPMCILVGNPIEEFSGKEITAEHQCVSDCVSRYNESDSNRKIVFPVESSVKILCINDVKCLIYREYVSSISDDDIKGFLFADEDENDIGDEYRELLLGCILSTSNDLRLKRDKQV